MSALEKKATELEWKLRSLPGELQAWRKLSELGQPFEKHHSQIRRLGLQMEALHSKVVSDFDQAVKDATLFTFADSLEKRALAVHTVWDFFRSKFALRAVEPLGTFLKMADAFARECYEPVRRQYVERGGADRREPPLVTFDNRVSPWALSRETRYAPASDPGGIIATTTFSEIVSKLPIPLLGLPWHYITYLPHVVFLAHECGHAVEKDFGLAESIESALAESKVDPARLPAWQAWRGEMFADVYACYAAGPSYAAALAEVLTRERSRIEAELRPKSQGWGDYPTTSLRILLSAAALERFGFSQDADHLRAKWLEEYPAHAMLAFEADIQAVVNALHVGASLPSRGLAFSAADSAQSRATAKLYLAGGKHQSTDVYPVRMLIAAAREMLTMPGATPATVERHWSALCRHAVTSRPPGLLAAEKQRADQLDTQAEAKQAETLTDILFGAILQADAADSSSSGMSRRYGTNNAPATLLGPDELPLPLGVLAESGEYLPGLTANDLQAIDDSPDAVKARGLVDERRRAVVSDVDPGKLEESGWGIVFAQDADPAIRQALEPLIEHRRKQVNDPRLFKLFEGAAGYRPGDSVVGWLSRFSVGLAIVDPLAGMPLYLLVVGSPAAIPFEFQYLLDTYWSVGRLDFDTAAEYRAYAEGVVAYETASTLPHRKQVAVFSTRNPGDRATALLMDQVATPLVSGTATMKPLGERQGFKMQPFLGEAATKDNLHALLRAQTPGGPPALLFTGSHGVSFALDDAGQRDKQGAILCDEWPGGPVEPAHYFTAADVPADAKVGGLVHFFFACYGGGCPQFDTYSRLPDGKPKQIAAAPMVARLPQKLLANGALAVVAHIDRAWSYSFQVGRGAPQVQEFRDVLVRAMKGERIGACTDQFNLRWAVLSAELSDLLRQQQALPGQVSNAALANRWVARDDARNYLTLGDPAVRLRVEHMAA